MSSSSSFTGEPRYTILVTPVAGVGHVNACAGACLSLLRRGHRIIFVVESSFRGKLSRFGYEEHLYVQVIKQDGVEIANNRNETKKPGQDWAQFFHTIGLLGPGSSFRKLQIVVEQFIQSQDSLESIRRMDSIYLEAIKLYKPDLIWVDAASISPSIFYSGIPWLYNMSISPLSSFSDEDYAETLPPSCSGYGIADKLKDERWLEFKTYHKNEFLCSKIWNDFIQNEMGYKRFPQDRLIPADDAILTVCAFPQELVYDQIKHKPWFNLEYFNQSTKNLFELRSYLPADFYDDNLDERWSGKWIYVSLGSFGSSDLEMMRRIVATIGTSLHKYIISSGPKHEQLVLPRNVWGECYVPQASLIANVDLVVTHGGNNTVTEVFSQGVPMVAIPIFMDQYDNAQRLHETGYGRRVDAYDKQFQPKELLHAIDQLLADDQLKRKLKYAAERIKRENKHEQLATIVEERLWKSKNGKN